MSAHSYKQQAARLSEHFSSVHKLRLKPASALEAIAAVHGSRDWNTLVATDLPQAPHAASLSTPQGALSYLFPKKQFSDTTFCDALLRLTTQVSGGPKGERQALIDHLVTRQIARGGGFIYLDLDESHKRDQLARAMNWAGRAPQYHVLTFAEPDLSESFNPLVGKDPDVLANIALSVLPSGESNPGADFYRQSANYFLTNLFAALLALNEIPTFEMLARILAQPDVMLSEIETKLPPDSAERMAFSRMLDAYRKQTKNGLGLVEERLKTTLGGIGGRFAMLSQGKLRRILNPMADSTLSWETAINTGLGVYVQLGGLGNTGTLEKLVMQSVNAALNGFSPAKDAPPFTVFVVGDHSGSFFPNSLSKHARKAGVGLVLTELRSIDEYFGLELNANVEAAGGFGRPAKVAIRNNATYQMFGAELEEFKGWSA